MQLRIPRLASVLGAGFLLLHASRATEIARLSFEELADTSDLVGSGQATHSWAAWDSNRKYIWTHYELSVTSVYKGTPGATVELAEPGGALDGIVMGIAGAVVYTPGEHVLVFLQRMPNGYLRTTGWSQGKYLVDAHGRIRAGLLTRGLEILDTGASAA